MTTTMSSSKQPNACGFFSLYRGIFRRYIGFELTYTLLGLLFFTLPYIMERTTAIRDKFEPNLLNHFFTPVSLVIFTILMIVLPIIVACTLFSYMHNKKAVDFYHAMPVTRERLLLVNVTVGLTMMAIPLIINMVLVWIISACWKPMIPFFALGYELIIWLVVMLAIFLITTLVAVNVGTTLETVIFSLAGIVILTAITGIAAVFCSEFIIGYNPGEFIDYLRYTPVGVIIAHFMNDSNYVTTTSHWMLGWLLISVVLYVVALLVYKRRKSEMAAQAAAPTVLAMVFKFFVAYCGAAFMGIIFDFMSGREGSKVVIVIGIAVGAALGYFLIESITARGFSTFKRTLPMLGIAAVVMTLLGVTVFTGGFGYEKRIPDASQIESATVLYQGRYQEISRYENRSYGKDKPIQSEVDGRYYKYNVQRGDYAGQITLTSDEGKDLVRRMHQAFIDVQVLGKETETGANGYEGVQIEYKTSTGTMHRYYAGAYPKEVIDCIQQMDGLEEVKKQVMSIFQVSDENIESVTAVDMIGFGQHKLALSKEQITQLMDCLRQDVLAETVQQMQMKDTKDVGYLSLKVKPNTTDRYIFANNYVLIRPYYTNTMAYLTEHDLLSAFAIDQSKVDKVAIHVTFSAAMNGRVLFPGDLELGKSTAEESDSVFVTSDRDEIAAIINSLSGLAFSHNVGEEQFCYEAEFQIGQDGEDGTQKCRRIVSFESLPQQAQEQFKKYEAERSEMYRDQETTEAMAA